MRLAETLFRIEVVEPVRLTTREERDRLLRETGLNVFRLPAESVTVDLLADRAPPAGPGGSEEAVRSLLGFRHLVPTRHGRSAPGLLLAALARSGDTVPLNLPLDPARDQREWRGVVPLPLLGDPFRPDPFFPGDLDVVRLERTLREVGPEKVPFVLLTLTDHSSGGQPVSLANVRAVGRVCRRFAVPLYFDARRFAENCWFIREREAGQQGRSVEDIAREVFSLGDGCILSVEPEEVLDPGGLLATNDEGVRDRIARRIVRIEGLPALPGGRDLESLCRRLLDSLEEDSLRARVARIRLLGELLEQGGVPFRRPVGGQALYLDARAFVRHVPQGRFPGQALTVALYRDFGIRAVEIGGLRFAARDPFTGATRYPEDELVRLSVPPGGAGDLWVGYLADAILDLHRHRGAIRGLRLVEDAPLLRHLTARLEEVDN